MMHVFRRAIGSHLCSWHGPNRIDEGQVSMMTQVREAVTFAIQVAAAPGTWTAGILSEGGTCFAVHTTHPSDENDFVDVAQ